MKNPNNRKIYLILSALLLLLNIILISTCSSYNFFDFDEEIITIIIIISILGLISAIIDINSFFTLFFKNSEKLLQFEKKVLLKKPLGIIGWIIVASMLALVIILSKIMGAFWLFFSGFLNFIVILLLIHSWNFPMRQFLEKYEEKFYFKGNLFLTLFHFSIIFYFFWDVIPIDPYLSIYACMAIASVSLWLGITYFNQKAADINMKKQVIGEIDIDFHCSQCNGEIDGDMQKALSFTDYIYCKFCGNKILKQEIPKIDHEEILSEHLAMIKTIKKNGENSTNIN